MSVETCMLCGIGSFEKGEGTIEFTLKDAVTDKETFTKLSGVKYEECTFCSERIFTARELKRCRRRIKALIEKIAGDPEDYPFTK